MQVQAIDFTPQLFPFLVNPLPEIRKLLNIPDSKILYEVSDKKKVDKIHKLSLSKFKEKTNNVGVNIFNFEEGIDYFTIGIPDYQHQLGTIILRNVVFFLFESSGSRTEAEMISYIDSKIDAISVDELIKESKINKIHYVGKVSKIIRKRSLDTVWIPKEQKDRIIKRVSRLFSKEGRQFSKRYGFRHKQCHILAGLPGTGKSILVHAIASHFSRPIFHIDMADPAINPCDRIKQVPPGCVVLIEDIDTSFRGIQGNDIGSKNVIISSFLNTLDGVDCADNVSIFITCNDSSILNLPAVRKGRFNYLEQFKGMTKETLHGMISSYYPEVESSIVENLTSHVLRSQSVVIPCDVEQYFLEFYDSYEEFSKALRNNYVGSQKYFENFHESVRSTNQYFRPDTTMMTM